MSGRKWNLRNLPKNRNSQKKKRHQSHSDVSLQSSSSFKSFLLLNAMSINQRKSVLSGFENAFKAFSKPDK